MNTLINQYRKSLTQARKAYRKNPTKENQIMRDIAWGNLIAVLRNKK
jgi:hypothetical protein